MYWMNPRGGFAFLALVAIVVLYMLKRKLEPRKVSSTFLWRKALAQAEADRPLQRLKRSLLLFTQLLLALLLALSLLRPMTPGDATGEALFIFDLSASMQANGGSGSRLETAIRDAQRRIDGFPEGTRVSVLTAGAETSQLLARSADLARAKRLIGNLSAQNGGSNFAAALSLASALQKELEDLQIIAYTDQSVDVPGITQSSIGDGLDNRAMLSLNASEAAAIARIANYGAAAELTVECLADGVLCDARRLFLAEGAIESLQFALPEEYQLIEARIAEADALPTDNIRYHIPREPADTAVVLAGRDNLFLEKALGLRSDITVLRTTKEEAALIEGGALTVFDGPLPETLPARGALLLIDPDSMVEARIQTPTTLSPAEGALADEINGYLQVDQIQVARYRPVSAGTPIWLSAGQPVLSVLEMDGRKVAVLGFDLHDSNLPLLKEFPLFIQSLLSLLTPEPLDAGVDDAACGDSIQITPQSLAREALVITPSGARIPIDLSGDVLRDTDDIGVYRLEQTDDAGDVHSSAFALHIPLAESDVRQTYASSADAEAGRGTAYGREWTPLCILFALLILLLEWWVYRSGY